MVVITRRDSNNTKLEMLMLDYSLTNEMVAQMTGYSIISVKAWLTKNVESGKYRPMQDRAMKLLEIEISSRNLKTIIQK